MLVKDTERIQKSARQEAIEKHRQQLKEWALEQTAHAVFVEDNAISPANEERQLGRPMFANDLEARLKKVVPNLHFEVNPFNSSKKALYHITPSRTKEYLCAYENGIMPEHSVMNVKVEEVWDPAVTHIDRKEMPRGQFRGKQEGWEFEAGTRPGFKKVRIPWSERKRGWRTVVTKLVLSNLMTIADAEKYFGADDRPEWAAHLGKRSDVKVPW